MDLVYVAPLIWLFFITCAGLAVGSFLNVLIARLPYEKSVFWPNSSCFNCLQPIRLADNLPIIGYLRLRGRCRQCGARFSSGYLGIELLTGLAFALLFCWEILAQGQNGPNFIKPWHHTPGLKFSFHSYTNPLPPLHTLGYFAYHALLLSLLISAAIIDAKHRIIPPQITYLGTLLGIVGAVLMPWPWPSLDVQTLTQINGIQSWILPEETAKIPTGAMLWPFWGPPPSWAPLGSWKLGLMNGVIGALVGTFMVRAIKFLFEVGLGREALGLGDADLMMMAGAFLGWQVVVIGFFAGAVAALLLKVAQMILGLVLSSPRSGGLALGRELPFGPGLALGIVAVWWGWPLVTDYARILYEPLALAIMAGVLGGGILIAGLLLRR